MIVQPKEPKIISAKLVERKKNVIEARVILYVTFENDDKEFVLYEFLPKNILLSPEEIIGMTFCEARHLRVSREKSDEPKKFVFNKVKKFGSLKN